MKEARFFYMDRFLVLAVGKQLLFFEVGGRNRGAREQGGQRRGADQLAVEAAHGGREG